MGDFTLAEESDIPYMYGCANGRAALRMYHAQFPDRRIPDHRLFYIVDFVKHVRSTLLDMMLVDKKLYTFQAWKKVS
ncbi:hypothetical protein TNCV_2611171 [Trichonephila clavipes]|nr:hypothetical protein TNCV_2611171 [Trichonephila clavipes]